MVWQQFLVRGCSVALAPEAKAYSALLAAQPDEINLLCGLASTLLVQGKFAVARNHFQRAVDLVPDCVEALAGQGECSLELGDFEDARDCFELARVHSPASLPALRGCGRLLRLSGDFGGAAALFAEALVLAGPHADLFFELGLTLSGASDMAGAKEAYEKSLAVEPSHLGALVNLGLCFLTQNADPARAQIIFERACHFHPEAVAAQANYGLALQEQGYFSQAIAHYDALLKKHADVVEYRWNRALAYLCLGDYQRGWQDYELRHVRGGRDVRRQFGLPEWAGDAFHGRHLLVYAEQGVGDEIMFASCLPQLISGAASVTIECDERLAAFFARAFPRATIRGRTRGADLEWLRLLPSHDAQIAIGSLPRILRKSADEFPLEAAYLIPDAARVEKWRRRLAAAGDTLAVGLSWRGGTRKTRGASRSLELTDFLPLAMSGQRRFVCLQRGDCSAEIEMVRAAGMKIDYWPGVLDDLEEAAALIAALDLVISVDNTIAHLAGAMGRASWTLLTHVPDWRYGVAGGTMPWYPSLRLFRQSGDRTWPPVVAAVAAALSQLPVR